MRRFLLALPLLALAAADAPAQGGVTRFCTPGANGATISASGSADFAANGGAGDLVLHGQGLPASTVGLFVQGNLQTPPKPIGNGFLCVGGAPQIWRLGAVSTGPSGTSVSYPIDYLSPPHPAATITPGSTWSFQLWFRDGASSDLTDAIEVQFVPPISLGSGTPLYTSNHTDHPLGQTFQGGALVIENDADFQAFWSLHVGGITPPPPPPPLDLTQVTAVVVMAGRRMTTGYSIEVRDVSVSVTSVDVTSLEQMPGSGCGVLFAVTEPIQIVTVPRIPSATLRTWSPHRNVYTCP
mgnify:CR=1 FL=1